MKVWNWIKNRLQEFSIGDPNSPEGLRHRAERLIKRGYPLDSPYISLLLKRALLKENRGEEIPSPREWDTKSDEQKEEWVLSQLKNFEKLKGEA